jgi:deoxyribodipyrimidine photo-lyase
MKPHSIFWFRRDLRLEDNAGLYHALKAGKSVLPIFIFDKNILDKLPERDARVLFIYKQIEKLKKQIEDLGSSLHVFYGKPLDIHKKLYADYGYKVVYVNRDYEPYAKERDKALYEFYKEEGVGFKGFKDQVIFDKSEITKDDGKPYSVFTPYMRKWKAALNPFHLKSYPSLKYKEYFIKSEPSLLISLGEMGFDTFDFSFPSSEVNKSILANYHETRDIPAIKGTSRMSIHLRFGTVSIRALCRLAMETNEKYFNELIWRDFYQMILHHFPHTLDKAFKPKYDLVEWENNEAHFKAWCIGKTGYPLVDAGMRELNETGFMHNRVRMLVASFLTKHLLVDWRWGEAYFAEKLLDYEAASNIGGWQWAAGSGVDASPYFRIFNPTLQLEKFDKDLEYVKKWIPEYGTASYPKPIVPHKEMRLRAIDRYKQALN